MTRMLIDRGASLDATTANRTNTSTYGCRKRPATNVGLLWRQEPVLISKIGRQDAMANSIGVQSSVRSNVAKHTRTNMNIEAAELKRSQISMSTDQIDDLLNSARHGDMQTVIDAMENGCPSNVQGSGGESLLMAAASSGNTKMIEYLIRKGVSMKTLWTYRREIAYITQLSYDVGVMLAGRGADLTHRDLTGTSNAYACTKWHSLHRYHKKPKN